MPPGALPARLIDVAQPDVPRVPAIDGRVVDRAWRPAPAPAAALDVHSGRARCSHDLFGSPSIVLNTEFPLVERRPQPDGPQHGRRATFAFVGKYEVDTTIRPGERFVIGRHRLGSARHRRASDASHQAQAEPLPASRIAKSLSFFIKTPWAHRHRIVAPLAGVRLLVTDAPVRRLTRGTSAKRGGHLFQSRIGMALQALIASGFALVANARVGRVPLPLPGPTSW